MTLLIVQAKILQNEPNLIFLAVHVTEIKNIYIKLYNYHSFNFFEKLGILK